MRAPAKHLFLASREVLPGLGLEGEVLTAQRVARMVDEGRPYVTLMTGPSRTADIERTLTIGVHGPRELRVVVVADESASP